MIKTGAEGSAAKITVTCSEEYEGTTLTFKNSGETITGQVSGGECVIVVEKSGTWIITNSVDEQSLTVEVTLSDYSLSLQGKPKIVYFNPEYSVINGGCYTQDKIVFTDIKAPESVQTKDMSENKDDSVVAWRDSNAKTFYISTQKSGTRIGFKKLMRSKFMSETQVGRSIFMNDDGDGYGSEIDLSNCDFTGITAFYGDGLGGQDNNPVGLFDNCKNLTTIDFTRATGLEVEKWGKNAVSYMFAFCSNLETIYCNDDWTTNSNVKNSEYAFGWCTKLVGDANKNDSSYVSGSFCKPKSKGGYFTSKN